MMVDPAVSPHQSEHQGATYHFCSARCREKFIANPSSYLEPKSAAAPKAVVEGVIYTCPMHPQIRQVGPGNCPICGMALEPEDTSAVTAPSHELADMSRRLWIGLVLSVPVVALEMGGHLTDLHMLLGRPLSNWIQFVLASHSYFVVKKLFLIAQEKALIPRKPSSSAPC